MDWTFVQGSIEGSWSTGLLHFKSQSDSIFRSLLKWKIRKSSKSGENKL